MPYGSSPARIWKPTGPQMEARGTAYADHHQLPHFPTPKTIGERAEEHDRDCRLPVFSTRAPQKQKMKNYTCFCLQTKNIHRAQ